MNTDEMLEIQIESKDEDVLSEIENALKTANPNRWKETRDLVTVLSIASSVVALVGALLDLKDRLSKNENPPKILILNADREQIDLVDASEETIAALIESARNK